MKTNQIISALVFTLLLILNSCGEDDTPMPDDTFAQTDDDPMMDDPDPAETLSMERQENISLLTADSERVWRITSAQLTNTSGTFNISNNFNVTDDEFIFKNTPIQTGRNTEFEGTLEWRGGFDFNTFATNLEETLTELFLFSLTTSFDYVGESGTQLEAILDEFSFNISINDDTVNAIWDFENSVILELELVPKLEEDYAQVPSSILEFTEEFTFQSNGISNFAPGMIGSLSSNSFYLATRESAFNNGSINPERVIKFDLNTGISTEKLTFSTDFVSKQLNIIDDRLYIAGGQRVNSYDLNLDNEATISQDYGSLLGIGSLGLSRYGTAVLENDIYIIGGDLDNNLSDQIFVFNTQTETMDNIATIPEPRSGARAEIVNNKLYIFGGTEEFFTPPAKETIYIYDLETEEITTESMPLPINFTFTGKTENLIYVAGRIDMEATETTEFDFEPYLGVYDTRTGVFTELETNLESPELETIHSMAVFNDKIYIIYGQGETQEEGALQTWSILSADI